MSMNPLTYTTAARNAPFLHCLKEVIINLIYCDHNDASLDFILLNYFSTR